MKKEKYDPANPTTPRGMILAANKGVKFDKRTKVGKSLIQIKRAVREDLQETAKALLEADVAFASVVQQLATEKIMADPNNAINEAGKASYHLGTWSKYSGIKRSSLLALKQFQKPKSKDKASKNLGDIILETSDFETEDEDQRTEPEPSDQTAPASESQGTEADTMADDGPDKI